MNRIRALSFHSALLLSLLTGCISQPPWDDVNRSFEGILASNIPWVLTQCQNLHEQRENIRVQGTMENARVDLDVHGLPIHGLLTTLLTQAEIPYLLEEIRLQGETSLTLHEVGIMQALEAMLAPLEAEAIWVERNGTKMLLVRNGSYSVAGTIMPASPSSSSSIKGVQIHHLLSNSLQASLFLGDADAPGLFPSGSAVTVAEQPDLNRLYFRGPEADLQECARIIRTVDQPQPQILVEVFEIQQHPNSVGAEVAPAVWQIISHLTGFKMVPTVAPATAPLLVLGRPAGPDQHVTAIYEAVVGRELVQSISRSAMVVAPGQTLTLDIGNNGYLLIYQLNSGIPTGILETLNTGLQLTITPQPLPNGHFHTQIQSNFSRFSQSTLTNLAANTLSHQVTSTVQVPNGGCILLGGLVNPSTDQALIQPLWLRNPFSWLFEGSSDALASTVQMTLAVRISRIEHPSLAPIPSLIEEISIPSADRPAGIHNLASGEAL